MVERCIENWDKTFLSLVNKFIAGVRAKGYGCDLVQSKPHQNGTACLLAISNGDAYKEHYQIVYSGLDIIGEYVNVQ